MRERLKRAVLKTAIPERGIGGSNPSPSARIFALGSFDSLRSLRISAHGSDAARRLNLKTAIPERVSGVQIPLPPPDISLLFPLLFRGDLLRSDADRRHNPPSFKYGIEAIGF